MKQWVQISALLFSSHLILMGQALAEGEAAGASDGVSAPAAAPADNGATATDGGAAAGGEAAPVDACPNDRAALDAIYTSLGGENWDKSGSTDGSTAGWGSDSDHCSWYGVQCDDSTGKVVGLTLNANLLSGTIPPEIGDLGCLEKLYLHKNQIGGTIPASITKLTRLKELLIDRNKIQGDIPSAIADMKALTKIDVDYNALHLARDATADTKTLLMQKHDNGDFIETQTLDARNLKVADGRTRTSIPLQWDPVTFTAEGGYRVYISESFDGPFVWHKDISGNGVNTATGEIEGKNFTEVTVKGLKEGTRYYFLVRSFTKPIQFVNENLVESDGKTGNVALGITDSDDSDLDGLLNVDEEKLGTDPNNPDSDRDGLWDRVEADPVNPKNTDKDALINALDPDDDNDNVPTRMEVIIPEDPGVSADPNAKDSDGDGTPDHLDADDDGDGVPTRTETTGNRGNVDLKKDTDGDGTPDYLDTDDDNDGISTFDETDGGKDIDKDSDGDGIPDYLDSKNDKVAVLEDTEDLVDTSIGGGAAGLGIAAAGLLGLIRRRRLIATAAAVAPLLLVSGMGMAATADDPAEAAKDAARKELDKAKGKLENSAEVTPAKKGGLRDEKIDFKVTQAEPERGGRIYLGLGAGLSTLQPEPKTSGVTVSDDNSAGYKFLFGYEATDHLSIEAMAGVLGNAVLSPGDKEVDYKVGSLFAVYNVFDHRVGFNPIIKVGVSAIENDNDPGVAVNEIDDTTLSAGIGLEYEFANGFAIRGEYEYYSEDARMASINVIKRMGGEPPIVIPAPAPAPVVPPPQPAQVNVAPPSVKVEFKIPDTDGDGVNDIRDACPNTPVGAEVDEVGCAKFQGVLKGVNFEYNSSRLTPRARAILDEVAEELKQYPNVKVQVEAHTDSKGSSQYNLWLSKARAQSVIDYLVSRGISSRRLIPIGFGETKPIASNATEQGRALNRRVEFRVLTTR